MLRRFAIAGVMLSPPVKFGGELSKLLLAAALFDGDILLGGEEPSVTAIIGSATYYIVVVEMSLR